MCYKGFHYFFSDGKLYDLKAKEFEILKLLMTYPKKIFTKAQSYESIWGDRYMADDNTVMVIFADYE